MTNYCIRNVKENKLLELLPANSKTANMEKELDAIPEGLAVVDETITADKLTKELVDAFVEKVILKPVHQVEIVWKFR